jgi:hypothetical protein
MTKAVEKVSSRRWTQGVNKPSASTFAAMARIEVEHLDRIISTLAETLGLDTRRMIAETTAEAAKTAAMYTPPDIGKRNPKNMKRIMRIFKTRKNEKGIYKKIPVKQRWYRVSISRGSKKSLKYTHSKEEAEKYRTITYRGAARAGWWGNVTKIDQLYGGGLKTNLNNIKTSNELISVSKRAESAIEENGYTARAVNTYPKIDMFAAVSQFMGYKSVVNRWKSWAASERRKMEAAK